MIGSESLKGKIRNIVNSKNLRSQEVLQMFFFERFLERLSKSEYQFNFVIKGGLLIAFSFFMARAHAFVKIKV